MCFEDPLRDSLEAFEDQVGGVLGALSSLKRDREEFNPLLNTPAPRGAASTTLRKEAGPPGAAAAPGEEGGEEDHYVAKQARRAQRERLIQFRYVRKIEPAVPPLRRPTPEEVERDAEMRRRVLGEPEPDREDIVLRNASPEILCQRRPSSRQRALVDFRQRNREHQRAVKERHSESVALWESFSEDQWSYKSAQVERARRRVRELAALAHVDPEQECRRRWLTLLGVVKCAMVLRDHHVQLRQQAGEAVDGASALSSPARLRQAGKTLVLARRTTVVPSLFRGDTPEEQEAMRLLVMRLQMRWKVRYRERRAAAVFECLEGWRLAGRIVLAFKHFMCQVRKIQKFWRRCRNGRLRQLRRQVEKRFLKAERAQIARDLSDPERVAQDAERLKETERSLRMDALRAKKEGQRQDAGGEDPSSPPRRSVTARGSLGSRAPTLSINERIDLGLLDDTQRLRFIANEMRTRRYLLLKKIYAWEQNMDRYWEEVRAWRDEKAAKAYLNLKFGMPPPLPPPCPSHVPTEEELADMVTRARKDLEDYSRAPTLQESRQLLRQQAIFMAGGGKETKETKKDAVEDLERGLDLNPTPQEGDWWEDAEEKEMQKFFPGPHAWN